MGANWGETIRLSIFGESHGKAIGINIDGLPAGRKITLYFPDLGLMLMLGC